MRRVILNSIDWGGELEKNDTFLKNNRTLFLLIYFHALH